MKITVDTILSELKKQYPKADCTLDWNTPLELLVATILAAQCTDKRVNQVGKALFAKYKTPQDFLRVSQEELEEDVRTCGSFRMKAQAIQESCQTMRDQFDGKVPQAMEKMLTLRGVGRKTAAVVLGTAFGVIEGIPIDTHNIRLLNRLGLVKTKNQDKIELQMMNDTPHKDWLMLSHLLVAHGRAVCTAHNRDCSNCPFQEDCPSSQTFGRSDKSKEGFS
ncbi:MAG: endonuclease III [Candidatus Peribacteraceae bacterium]|jgi:endonuclease-3|nr:endonuclease III [Candidatus Peribacteraceae bacterium]|tara:strand:+ start:29833 stop:30495 length:663 start_codon:yes stop_codon:yes gene_type:complete